MRVCSAPRMVGIVQFVKMVTILRISEIRRMAGLIVIAHHNQVMSVHIALQMVSILKMDNTIGVEMHVCSAARMVGLALFAKLDMMLYIMEMCGIVIFAHHNQTHALGSIHQMQQFPGITMCFLEV